MTAAAVRWLVKATVLLRGDGYHQQPIEVTVDAATVELAAKRGLAAVRKALRPRASVTAATITLTRLT